MKKLFLIAMMAIMTLSVSAQTNETIEFMGIPIDGTETLFTNKLKAKGLEFIPEMGVYKGQFTGEDAMVLVCSTEKMKLVYSVIVALGTKNTWSQYTSAVEDLVELFKIKYGEPFLIEKYTYPFQQGDGHEITALRSDKLLYVYMFDNGITISVDKTYGIMIIYKNKANEQIYKQEEKTQKLKDI